MKAATKTILSVLALATAFGLGYGLNSYIAFLRGWTAPSVESDSHVRHGIHSFPDQAHHIYQSQRGFVEVDRFMAFSADRPTIEAFLKSNFDLRVDSFMKTDALPKQVRERGPDSWGDQYRDPNWDLRPCKEFLVHDADSHTIIYVANQNRLFVCDWAR